MKKALKSLNDIGIKLRGLQQLAKNKEQEKELKELLSKAEAFDEIYEISKVHVVKGFPGKVKHKMEFGKLGFETIKIIEGYEINKILRDHGMEESE